MSGGKGEATGGGRYLCRISLEEKMLLLQRDKIISSLYLSCTPISAA